MKNYIDVYAQNVRACESSTSRLAYASHTGLEAFILLAVTNSALFSLGPAAVSLITTGLTTLVTAGAVIGLNYLAMPKPPKPEDGKAPKTQAIPHRIFGVGTNRVAGAYMLWEAKDGVLYAVTALCGHPINAIIAHYLHDDIVTLDGSGNVEDGPNERYGNNKIWIGTRLGAVPETPYAELVTPLSAEGIWTNNHRGDGQASMAMRCIGASSKNFAKYYPYGHPQPSVVMEMAKVWDFRDGAQDPDDPDTWAFSKNPVLIMVWQHCFNPFGPQESYVRAILPYLDIWVEEADICDEDVARNGGGTEKRYECNGWATTETDPVAIQNSILASCDGWICRLGTGALIMRVGKFREELVGTIRDVDVTGRTIQYDVAPEESINRLVPKFTYPATDYTTSDTDFFESAEKQIEDGRVLSQDADFGWVQQWRQARRLGKREWLRQLQKIRGSVDVRLSGINAVYSRWLRFETPMTIPALNGMVVENRRAIVSLMRGGFQIDFVQHPDNIDDWNPSIDEGAAPPVPAKPSADEAPVPTIDGVQVLSYPGGVMIRVTIIDPSRDDITPMTAWRLADDGSGSPGEWNEKIHEDWEVVGGLIALDIAPVISDQNVEVRAAFKAPNGVTGTWTTPPEEVFTVLDPVEPVALTGFSVTGGSKHLGHAPFTISTDEDDHLSRIAIYRVPAGGVLDKNTHLVTRLYGVQAASTFGYVNGDNTVTNALPNGEFDSGAGVTLGTGWTVGSGALNGAAGSISLAYQAVPTISAGSVVRLGFDVSAYSAGSVNTRINPGVSDGASRAAVGTYLERRTVATDRDQFAFRKDAAFAGSVDNAALFVETPGCAPQGDWDYYAIPENGSGIPGPTSGPVNVIVV